MGCLWCKSKRKTEPKADQPTPDSERPVFEATVKETQLTINRDTESDQGPDTERAVTSKVTPMPPNVAEDLP